ncbi:MAG: hypothetical protein JWQ25_2157, partial [Daejeonella sp.]|nr:hypothetical protein [Daejeonella sp.]
MIVVGLLSLEINIWAFGRAFRCNLFAKGAKRI